MTRPTPQSNRAEIGRISPPLGDCSGRHAPCAQSDSLRGSRRSIRFATLERERITRASHRAHRHLPTLRAGLRRTSFRSVAWPPMRRRSRRSIRVRENWRSNGWRLFTPACSSSPSVALRPRVAARSPQCAILCASVPGRGLRSCRQWIRRRGTSRQPPGDTQSFAHWSERRHVR